MTKNLTKKKPIRVLVVGLVLLVFLWGFMSLQNSRRVVVEGKTVAGWVEEIAVSDYDRKKQLEEMLVESHPESLYGLVQVLETRAHPIHIAMANMWTQLTPFSWGVPDYDVSRAHAARIIGQFDSDVDMALPALADAAAEDVWSVSEQARLSLIRLFESSTEFLAHRLGGKYPIEAQLGWASIIDSVGGRSTQNTTLVLLESYERCGPTIRVAILEIFEDPAFHTAGVLKLLEGEASPSNELLVTRVAALQAIGFCTDSDTVFLDAMNEGLEDTHLEIRFAAAVARCRLGKRPAEVLSVIIEGLESDQHRVEAVSTLGDLGEIAEPAIDELLNRLVKERNPRPMRMPPLSGVALSRIGTNALPGLVALLDHETASARLNIVVTLGVFGRRANMTGPALLPLLSDEDKDVRQATALTLSNIGHHTREAIPVLLVLAQDDDPFMATWAGEALAEIDPGLTPLGRR